MTARSQSTIADARVVRSTAPEPYASVRATGGVAHVPAASAPQRQAPSAAARSSRAARASRVSASGTRSAISTKTIGSPSRSVAMPARRADPGEGAGLGAHPAAARRSAPSSKRYASEPVKPATGSPVTHRRSSGWSADAASRSTATQGGRGRAGRARDSPLPSYDPAPVRSTPSRPSVRAHAARARRRTSPRRRWPARPGGASTSARLVVADQRAIRSTISRQRRAVDAGELAARRPARRRGRGGPTTVMPGRGQGVGEDRGRRRAAGRRPGRSRSACGPRRPRARVIGATTPSGT